MRIEEIIVEQVAERLQSRGQELAQASSRSRSRFRPSDPDRDDVAQDPVDLVNIDDDDMDSGLVSQELTAWLEKNKSMFKPGEWAVLSLHLTDGLTMADAADRLGISRADVRRFEKQAIGKLRRNPEFQRLFSSRLEHQEDQDFDDGNLNEWIPDRKYCQSRSADKLGASQAASCKSQGFIGRDSKVKARLGKSRERIGTRTVKGRKYGGPTPDWS
jgi:hypothetical protein